jgi:hypothetical protein
MLTPNSTTPVSVYDRYAHLARAISTREDRQLTSLQRSQARRFGAFNAAVSAATKPTTAFTLVGIGWTRETWRIDMTNRQSHLYAMRCSNRREKELQAMWNQQMRENGAALRALVPMPDVLLLTATCSPTLPTINNGRPHLVSVSTPRTDRYVPALRASAAARLGGLE